MAEFKTRSGESPQNFGTVDVLVQLFSANKSVKHVEKLVKGHMLGQGEINYDNLFTVLPNTNYVLRLTNVTRSSSTLTYILTNDGTGLTFKNPSNVDVSGSLLAGQSVEHTVVIPSPDPFNCRLQLASNLDNATPAVTSQISGANVNLIRNGNVVGNIPNVATFDAGPAGTYTNVYFIQNVFNWDWSKLGADDGLVKIGFTFQNAVTPIEIKIDAGAWTIVNPFNLSFPFPENTSPVIKFRDASGVEITKTVAVGALPGAPPAAPTVAVSNATTDDTIPITFESGIFQLEVLRGGNVVTTIGSAQSPYNYKFVEIGSHAFRIRNANGPSLTSSLVNVTQGQNQTPPPAPILLATIGTVGIPFSGTSAQNGTLLVFLNDNQLQSENRLISGNAFSFTPTVAGIYKFKMSNTSGVSVFSNAVTVSAGGNVCNLVDGTPIADSTISGAAIVPRSFDGGQNFVVTQLIAGNPTHFRALGKDFLDGPNIQYRSGYSAAVKSCFGFAESGEARPADFLTPAGFETYLIGSITVFKLIEGDSLIVDENENEGNVAAQAAWHTTNVFAEVPSSRWIDFTGTPKTATFTAAFPFGIIYLFAREKSSGKLLASSQVTNS